MKTILLQPTAEGYDIARQLITSGQLVAFPTETVYGLGADATNASAVDAIYTAKGRPSDNPLIVHVASKDQIHDIVSYISPLAHKVIDNFMPGSITIVLPKNDSISHNVTAGLDTVAVRIPASEQARRFIANCGVPITAPSANTSTKPSPTNYQDVLEDMDGKISAVMVGQDCTVGIESTVLDLTTNTPTILRPGIITASMLQQVLGVQVATYVPDDGKVVNSPGVKYRHYAPSCPVVLNTDGDIDKINRCYDSAVGSGHNAVILTSDTQHGSRQCCNLGNSDQEVARNMFSLLRQCDRLYSYIIIVYSSKTELSHSILNRLTKTASGNIL